MRYIGSSGIPWLRSKDGKSINGDCPLWWCFHWRRQNPSFVLREAPMIGKVIRTSKYITCWVHLSQPWYPLCPIIALMNARAGASAIIEVSLQHDTMYCWIRFPKTWINSIQLLSVLETFPNQMALNSVDKLKL